jgi:hypothetical protein
LVTPLKTAMAMTASMPAISFMKPTDQVGMMRALGQAFGHSRHGGNFVA